MRVYLLFERMSPAVDVITHGAQEAIIYWMTGHPMGPHFEPVHQPKSTFAL